MCSRESCNSADLSYQNQFPRLIYTYAHIIHIRATNSPTQKRVISGSFSFLNFFFVFFKRERKKRVRARAHVIAITRTSSSSFAFSALLSDRHRRSRESYARTHAERAGSARSPVGLRSFLPLSLLYTRPSSSFSLALETGMCVCVCRKFPPLSYVQNTKFSNMHTLRCSCTAV